MANKTQNTRQKLMFRLEASGKPRNPVAVAAKQRHAGAHGPSVGGERVQARTLLQKLLKQMHEPDSD